MKNGLLHLFSEAVHFSINLLFADPVKREEDKSDRHERNEKDRDPFCHAAHVLSINIQKEIGIYQRSSCGGDEYRGIKLQDRRLNKYENNVCNREAYRGYGVIPLDLSSFIEQKPIGYVHNGENDVEGKTSYAPIELRVASGRACEHDIEDKEGEQNTEHTDKL